MALIMGAFIPMFDPDRVPSCDSIELMAKSPVREKSYIVLRLFEIPPFETFAEVDDIIYTNVGDNRFYLEKKMTGMTYYCEVEWSIVMRALKYGWIELEKVEKPG
jgi:hypothetical protein